MWCVVTATPGVYVVGKGPPFAAYVEEHVWLNQPYLMRMDGGKMTFEPIDVIQDVLLVRLAGQPGVGQLSSEWVDKYLTFLES